MRRWIPTALALLAIFALVQLFRLAQRFDPTAPAPAGYQEAGLGDVSIRLDDTIVIQRNAGVPIWQLHAKQIDLRRAPGGDFDALRQAEFKSIDNGILYREGKPDARF